MGLEVYRIYTEIKILFFVQFIKFLSKYRAVLFVFAETSYSVLSYATGYWVIEMLGHL